MEPGVPFALLGIVALLVMAAWSALAAAAAVRAVRPGWGHAAAALVAVGAALLGYADLRSSSQFGLTSSDRLLLVRVAGALLLVAGLAALRLPVHRATPQDRATPPDWAKKLGWSAPLDWSERLVGAGLVVSGVAGVIAVDGSPRPVLVMALRGTGALLVLGGLAGLTRRSLLSKVVAGILAGVVVMAAASVGVVGTVVVRAYDRQASSLVEQAAQSRLQTLDNTLEQTKGSTSLALGVCARGRILCDSFLRATDPSHHTFAAQVFASGETINLGGSQPLSQTELMALSAACPTVVVLHNVCRPSPTVIRTLPAYLRLASARPAVAAVVVQAVDAATATARPASVFVYGVRIDTAYAENDFVEGGYGFHLITHGQMVASDGPVAVQQQILALARRAQVETGIPVPVGLTLKAQGSSPTVHFAALQGSDGTVAVLAVSRDASQALSAQQDALRALLLTAFAATAFAALFAVLLGRRTVDPVRRLTAAAERVRSGDLTATAALTSPDEIGTLSRTFDSMTGSLAQLTDDLRASAAQLQSVLISMSDGLIAADGQGLITTVNPAALAMLGGAAERDVLSRPIGQVVRLTEATGARLPTDGQRLYDVPADVTGSSGRPVAVRAALARLASGDGVVLLLRDTSQEREVERMKTEFLSNVSHELRTPLTPIRGYADMLATRPGLTSAQVGTFASTILSESLKMNRVVDLLVDVAALEAGRLTMEPRPVRAAVIVDELLVAWRARVPERATDLRRRVSTKLPVAQVDPRWLAKALDEFIDNAVKYTPVGTAITLGATRAQDGRSLRLYVRDDGPGIPADKQDLLFTSFEQVDGSATRKVGGLGLGLSFVRRLAQDAGWVLSATSTVGTGSEFSLELPAVGTAAPETPTPVAVPVQVDGELSMAAARKAQIKQALLTAAEE